MVLLTGPWLMKRGALQPPYRGTIRRADKSPVDLSDPTIDHVDFVMRQRHADTPVVEAAAQIIQAGDAVTGTNVGVCEYDWQAGDTDLSGDYYGEFAFYDANGNVLVRVPNDSYQEIRILGNLSTVPIPILTAISPTQSSASDPSEFTLTFTGTGFDRRIVSATLTSPGPPQTSSVQLISATEATAQFLGVGAGNDGSGTAYLLDPDGKPLTAELPFTWLT
jgi:hypothetical protein